MPYLVRSEPDKTQQTMSLSDDDKHGDAPRRSERIRKQRARRRSKSAKRHKSPEPLPEPRRRKQTRSSESASDDADGESLGLQFMSIANGFCMFVLGTLLVLFAIDVVHKQMHN